LHPEFSPENSMARAIADHGWLGLLASRYMAHDARLRTDASSTGRIKKRANKQTKAC
jgi:hypothetical protein